MTKKMYQSKTMWFNLLVGLGSLFSSSGVLGFVFSPAEIGAFLSVGNVILRLFTSKGILTDASEVTDKGK